MKDKASYGKIIIKCIDFAGLLVYSFLTCYYVLADSTINSADLIVIDTDILKVILVISLVKIYILFDYYRFKSITAIIILAWIYIGMKIGLFGTSIAFFAIMIVVLMNIPFNRILKVYISTMLVALLVIFVLSMSEIIPSTVATSNRYGVSVMNNIGFDTHDNFIIYWLFLMMGIIYLAHKTKWSILTLILSTIVTLFLYKITASRTSTIIGCLFCILVFIHYCISKIRKIDLTCAYAIICKLMIGMPLFSIVFTIFGVLLGGKYGYSIGVWSLMDRYVMSYKALQRLGVQLPYNLISKEDIISNFRYSLLLGIGNNSYPGPEYFDILYVRMIIDGGLFLLIPYIVMQVHMLYSMYRKKQYMLMLIISMQCFLGCFELGPVYKEACIIFNILLLATVQDENNIKRLAYSSGMNVFN